MWKFRILLITLFIFCIILAFLGISYIQKKAKSEQLIDKNQTIVEAIKQKENITSIDQLGTTWKDFNKIGEGNFLNTNIITSVSDGEIIRDPIEIKTKEGELIATSIAAFKGYYYDISNHKQSIIIPMLIKLSDGRIYHPAYLDAVSWNEEEIKSKILNNPAQFGATKGIVMQVGSFQHVPQEYLAKFDNQSIRYSIIQSIDKYNKSWQTEVDKFYNKGDPEVGIIFTFNYFSPAIQYVVTF